MKLRDWAVIAGLIVLALGMMGVQALRLSPAGEAVVSVGGAEQARVALDRDELSQGQGALGPYEIAVEGGSVRMVRSACPDGLCVRQGSIGSVGQSIVCLPNQVSVRLISDSGDGLDAVVR